VAAFAVDVALSSPKNSIKAKQAQRAIPKERDSDRTRGVEKIEVTVGDGLVFERISFSAKNNENSVNVPWSDDVESVDKGDVSHEEKRPELWNELSRESSAERGDKLTYGDKYAGSILEGTSLDDEALVYSDALGERDLYSINTTTHKDRTCCVAPSFTDMPDDVPEVTYDSRSMASRTCCGDSTMTSEGHTLREECTVM